MSEPSAWLYDCNPQKYRLTISDAPYIQWRRG